MSRRTPLPLTQLDLMMRVERNGGWDKVEVLVPKVSRSSGFAMLDTMRWRAVNTQASAHFWMDQAGEQHNYAVYDVRTKYEVEVL